MPRQPQKYPKKSLGLRNDDNTPHHANPYPGQREEAYPKQRGYGYHLPLTGDQEFSKAEGTLYETSDSVPTQYHGQSPPKIRYLLQSYQPQPSNFTYEGSLASTASHSPLDSYHSPKSQHSQLGSSPPNSSSSRYGHWVRKTF